MNAGILCVCCHWRLIVKYSCTFTHLLSKSDQARSLRVKLKRVLLLSVMVCRGNSSMCRRRIQQNVNNVHWGLRLINEGFGCSKIFMVWPSVMIEGIEWSSTIYICQPNSYTFHTSGMCSAKYWLIGWRPKFSVGPDSCTLMTLCFSLP